MNSYVTQIIETGQKLSGTGFNIKDEWVASLLLAELTENYSPMVMAIEHCGIALTANAIKSKNLKQILSNKFSVKDLGEVKQCLGMNVTFNEDTELVTLSQENDIDQLLNKFHLGAWKIVDTPM